MKKNRIKPLWVLAAATALLMAGGCANPLLTPAVPDIADYLAASPSPEAPTADGDAAVAGAPLELAACVRIALADNPVGQAAREGVAAARENIGIARSRFYPQVGLTGSYRRWESHAFLPDSLSGAMASTPATVGPTDDWSAGGVASFYLFDSGRRRAQLLAAKAQWGAQQAEQAAVEQDIALNVHQAFYSLLAAQESLRVAQENSARAEDHFRLTQDRKSAGMAVQADVLRAQVEVADRHLAIVRAEHGVRVARGNLNLAMGLPAEMPVEIDSAAPGAPVEPAPLADDLATAMEQRPELRAALNRVASARSGVSAAKSEFGPAVKADARYGWRDTEFTPEDKDWLIGVGIELPLFTGFSRTHQLQRARHELSKEEALLRQLALTIRQEVWDAHSRVQEAMEALDAAGTLVASARESQRLSRQRFEAGTNTITDLLDAEAAQARAEGLQVEARWNYFISRAALARAIGAMDTK
ncbi:MAG TPA: TolC family protein [Kiritimatiellia bacterium]|nr:TolC family protein [Kiritimatiellia bacterium]